jgi:ABC-2 type transport system permease protein
MKLLKDSWLVFTRAVGQTVRNPVWLFVSLAQPIYFLVLFGPLLKRVVDVQGFPGGGAFNVFVPGLLIQLAMFGCAFVGFSLIAEMRAGVIERLQVTPISRTALLLGRAGRDVASLLVQVVILVLLAWPFGLHLNVGGIAVAMGLLVLVGTAFSAVSYTLAPTLKTEDALAPLLNAIAMPMMLLSGILLPLSLAPGWLQAIGDANPLTYAVDATRSLFNGHLATGDVLWGLVIMTAAAVVAVTVATRRFRRAAA